MTAQTQSRPEALLATRGAESVLDAPVTAVTATADGRCFAFATLDGDIVKAPVSQARSPETWHVIPAHDAPISCLSPDPQDAAAILAGGEDCRLTRINADNRVDTLFSGRKWVEHIATSPKHLAFSCGKTMELRDASGTEIQKSFDHPSTVTGIGFDPKNKRVVASHYNGVSMWFVNSDANSVRSLTWKGSHTGVAFHPKGDALVTTMQENDLHGWRLSDGHNMRMSGYPRKVASMDFTHNGRWLATSGADAIVMWPFFGGGPMGKPPRELARLPGTFCTAVKTHPSHDVVAAGFEDGLMILIDLTSEQILPVRYGGSAGESITKITFSPQGDALAYGTETGAAGVVILNGQTG